MNRKIKHLILLIYFVATFSLKIYSSEVPKIEICKFKDGKKAAVSLTFDDATKDHLSHAVPLLDKYGFKGTFYVIVKRVPEIAGKKYLTWKELKQIADHGHEIGNHSMTHYQLTKAKSRKAVEDEITRPIPIIEEKTGFKPQTFCYPGNSRNKDIVKIAESVHVGSTNCRRYFYGGANFDLAKQDAWLDDAVNKELSHIAMIHGIVPGGGGWRPFDNVDVFEQILRNFKKREKDIWIATFADFCKYKKLKDSATIELQNKDFPLIFTVKTAHQYNFPLTVRITPCPENMTAVQNGKNQNIIHRDKSGFIDVIPENGSVKLTIQK